MLEQSERDRSEERAIKVDRLTIARDTCESLRNEVDRLRTQLAHAGGDAGLRVRRAEQLIVRWQLAAVKLREKAATSGMGALMQMEAGRLEKRASELAVVLY